MAKQIVAGMSIFIENLFPHAVRKMLSSVFDLKATFYELQVENFQ